MGSVRKRTQRLPASGLRALSGPLPGACPAPLLRGTTLAVPLSTPTQPTHELPLSVFRLMAASVGIVVANIYYAQPLLPDLAREFGLSVTGAGSIVMLAMGGAGLGQILFVPLGDIRERRKLIVGMTLASGAALALTAFAQSAAWLMLATFLLGITASVNHITIPFAAHLAPPSQRGRVVGIVVSGLLTGILISRAWAGWIGEIFGWRAVFAIGTVFMLVLAVAMGRALPESRPTSNLSWPQLIASVVPLWRELPVLREAVLINSIMFCVFSGFWTSMVFFVEGHPYFYTSRGAGLFSLIGAAGAVCAPFAGRFVDRHGGHGAVAFGIGGMMLSFLVLGFGGTNLAMLVVGVILLDLAMQFCHVTNQTRIYGLIPEARSRLNMVYMTCSFSGGAAGSYLSTWFWNAGGWWGVCGFSLAMLTLAMLIWWRLNTGRRSGTDALPAGALARARQVAE